MKNINAKRREAIKSPFLAKDDVVRATNSKSTLERCSVRPVTRALHNAHVPSAKNRARVKIMALSGFFQREIAAVLHIDEKTLRKHYADEIARGRTAVEVQVAGTLLSIALDMNHPKAFQAAKTFLERRLPAFRKKP